MFHNRLALTERCLNFIVLILEYLVHGVPSSTQISLAITQPPLQDRICGFNSVSRGATKMSYSIRPSTNNFFLYFVKDGGFDIMTKSINGNAQRPKVYQFLDIHLFGVCI